MKRSVRRVLTVLILVASAGLTAAGGFLTVDTFMQERPSEMAAMLGAMVTIPGGLLRVDRVTTEQMAPMKDMPGMAMDMAPKGYRRLTVEITLVGEAGSGLRYAVDQFRLTGRGMPEIVPLRHRLGDGLVTPGSATSGSLMFQVPEAADELLLRFRGGARPIALDPGPATDRHSHADPSSGSADGEDDGHEHR